MTIRAVLDTNVVPSGLFWHGTPHALLDRGLHKSGALKRGPTPLLQKQIERLNRLPKAQQKVVLKMLDGVLSQHR